MKQKKHHLKHIKSYATLDLKKADLSKDMKKQSHTGKISTKPINKKQLSSDKSLSPKPKVGRYNAPNSKKKLSSEEFLATSKLTHLKEMSQFFIKEGINAISKEDAAEYLDGSKYQLSDSSVKGVKEVKKGETMMGYLWYPESSKGQWAAQQKGEGAYAFEN